MYLKIQMEFVRKDLVFCFYENIVNSIATLSNRKYVNPIRLLNDNNPIHIIKPSVHDSFAREIKRVLNYPYIAPIKFHSSGIIPEKQYYLQVVGFVFLFITCHLYGNVYS